MRLNHLFYLLSSFIIAFFSCTKSPSDQRQQEKKCLHDSTVTKGSPGFNIKNVSVYDEQDRWVGTRHFDNYLPNGHSEFKYGQDGKIITLIQYTAGGAKSEERQYSYNAQGKISGYTLNALLYTTPVKRVNYVYEENKLTLVGIGDAGTLYEYKRFYENGNEVKIEFWSYGQLASVETIEYGPQIYKHHYDENVVLAYSNTFLSKNLHSRRKIFNNLQNKYTTDENYVFELNSEGYIVKSTTTTNLPIPPQAPAPVPIVAVTTYRCN